MTDIFADWKKNKFIIISADLLDSSDEKLVILSDYKYWANYEDELDAWCELHSASRQGMTVAFPDEKTLTAFALKWS